MSGTNEEGATSNSFPAEGNPVEQCIAAYNELEDDAFTQALDKVLGLDDPAADNEDNVIFDDLSFSGDEPEVATKTPSKPAATPAATTLQPTKSTEQCRGARAAEIKVVEILAKPKRSLSAYNFFFQAERQKLLAVLPVRGIKPRRSHGKMGFAEMARTISAKWKQITESEKMEYEQMAALDGERYEKQMAAWKQWKADHPVEAAAQHNASKKSSGKSNNNASKKTHSSSDKKKSGKKKPANNKRLSSSQTPASTRPEKRTKLARKDSSSTVAVISEASECASPVATRSLTRKKAPPSSIIKQVSNTSLESEGRNSSSSEECSDDDDGETILQKVGFDLATFAELLGDSPALEVVDENHQQVVADDSLPQTRSRTKRATAPSEAAPPAATSMPPALAAYKLFFEAEQERILASVSKQRGSKKKKQKSKMKSMARAIATAWKNLPESQRAHYERLAALRDEEEQQQESEEEPLPLSDNHTPKPVNTSSSPPGSLPATAEGNLAPKPVPVSPTMPPSPTVGAAGAAAKTVGRPPFGSNGNSRTRDQHHHHVVGGDSAMPPLTVVGALAANCDVVGAANVMPATTAPTTPPPPQRAAIVGGGGGSVVSFLRTKLFTSRTPASELQQS